VQRPMEYIFLDISEKSSIRKVTGAVVLGAQEIEALKRVLGSCVKENSICASLMLVQPEVAEANRLVCIIAGQYHTQPWI
jgi:hypothetical protein